jgi:hypothetical protein
MLLHPGNRENTKVSVAFLRAVLLRYQPLFNFHLLYFVLICPLPHFLNTSDTSMSFWHPKLLMCQARLLTSVILQEAEIRRIVVQNQPRQIVCETLYWKNPSQERCRPCVQTPVPQKNKQTKPLDVYTPQTGLNTLRFLLFAHSS